MGNDTRPRVRIKPIRSVMTFRAYPDTMVLFLPTRSLMTTETNRLREAYGAKPHMPVNNRLGYTMIHVQCPQPELLHELDDLYEKYDGVISRLDPSFEAMPDPTMSVDDQTRWIKGHMLMKRRPAGPILEIRNDADERRNGTFFIPHAHTSNSPRDVCLYAHHPSKIDRRILKIPKFDLRLRTKEAFGTPYRDKDYELEAIVRPRDVIKADPSVLFKRHLRIVRFDMQEFERRLFRELAEGQTTEEAKRMISNQKRNWNEDQYQFQYVQRIHDHYPRMTMETDYGLVTLPKTFTWGAVRRSMTNQSVTGETCHSSSLKHVAARERIRLEQIKPAKGD